MKRRTVCSVLMALLLGVTSGCGMRTGSSSKKMMLCGTCGYIKGSSMCCKPGAATCPKCGLAKGSPGCCKMHKGADKALCPKCGQIQGSALCCKPGAMKCSMCGMAKGSPGCCAAAKGM